MLFEQLDSAESLFLESGSKMIRFSMYFSRTHPSMSRYLFRYDALNKMVLGEKYSRIPKPAKYKLKPKAQAQIKIITTANDWQMTRPPFLLGRAAVCPAAPNTMPSIHGPRVRRRSSASLEVVSRSASSVHVRAHTQVRPGRSRRARRRSPIGQRRRPAAVPPRCRHVKKEHYVLNISSHPSPNHSLVVVLVLLLSSPGCSAIGQRRLGAVTYRCAQYLSSHEKGLLVKIRSCVCFICLSSSVC